MAWKSTKTQKWDTITKQSGSGAVRTLTTWQYPEWTISVTFNRLTPDDYKTLMGFFATVKGGALPFLWLDPEDNHEKGVLLGRGSMGKWPAVRKFGDFLEPAPYVDNVTLYADGKPLKNAFFNDGYISTTDTVTSDAVITADYRYYWRVRFADDKLTTEATFINLFRSKSFKLVTVK